MKMKIVNESDIIQSGSIKVDEGMMPARIVIRHIPENLHNHYVVHRENLKVQEIEPGIFEWTHAEFYWGHYFSKLEDAQKDFEDRK
jgi:hypothetical protein